jgi:hypothetical protein
MQKKAAGNAQITRNLLLRRLFLRKSFAPAALSA